MPSNQDFYEFLIERAKQLTDYWYNSLDKSNTSGVYSSSNPQVIENLKNQNFEFHGILCSIFIKERLEFEHDLDEWILSIAEDKEHIDTPNHHILKEFVRVREQYLGFLQEFKDRWSSEEDGFDVFNEWWKLLVQSFDHAMVRFVEMQTAVVNKQLQAQQEVINELSSPVIKLNDQTALLPLVGNIEPTRAEYILESALEQCVEKGVSQLFIDLSGVVLIDTMVAHQLFNLMDALQLIGVKPILSGLRPEIAQTAVQLGLKFDNLTITSTLSQALNRL